MLVTLLLLLLLLQVHILCGCDGRPCAQAGPHWAPGPAVRSVEWVPHCRVHQVWAAGGKGAAAHLGLFTGDRSWFLILGTIADGGHQGGH